MCCGGRAEEPTSIEDLRRPPVAGEIYELDCIVIGIDRIALPILGHPHDDRRYGVSLVHYHLDQRFMSDEAMAEYGVLYFLTPDGGLPHVERRLLVCRRSEPKYNVLLNGLGSDYEGRKAISGGGTGVWRCPHQGAYLGNVTVGKGGCLRCPMHGLRIKRHTGKVSGKYPL